MSVSGFKFMVKIDSDLNVKQAVLVDLKFTFGVMVKNGFIRNCCAAEKLLYVPENFQLQLTARQ